MAFDSSAFRTTLYPRAEFETGQSCSFSQRTNPRQAWMQAVWREREIAGLARTSLGRLRSLISSCIGGSILPRATILE